MKKITFSIISILALNGFSFAGGSITPVEETIFEAPNFETDSAFYVGLGYSYITSNRTAKHNTPGEIQHGEKARDVDTNANAMLLQAGYKFNQYIALEGRYTFSMSDLTLTNNLNGGDEWDDNIDLTNVALYLKPMYPIGDFSVYGLLGYGKVERKDDDDSRGDWDDSCFQWGLGAQYVITEDFLIFADYTQWHDSDDEKHPAEDRLLDTDFSAISVGVSYKF